MTATVDSILEAAHKEWDYWGNSTWNTITNKKKIGHYDNEKAYAEYVIDQYCKVGGGHPTIEEIQNDEYAWSAVGMSAFMYNGDLPKDRFPYSQSHSTFIRKFIAARNVQDQKYAYWGYPLGLNDFVPEVGDLIAYARGKGLTPTKAAAFIDRTSAYDSHTDLVVAKRPGEIDVIGANVMDSVTMKTLRIDQNGHIADNFHHWFAVLKHRL